MRRSSCANEAAHARTSFGTLDALPMVLVLAGRQPFASQAMWYARAGARSLAFLVSYRPLARFEAL